MHINKIKIENFKSIYEPITIDFDDVKGFWKIAGPVGAGKTTLGEAILFGLFGAVNGKNNGNLISWGRKHGLIELWCESSGHSIYIKRQLNAYGQSPTYVEIDGDELIATNKRNIQGQLESEYYDISRMSVELLCIISFNNFKSLATLNTADTKKFLDQVLGFYTLSQYIDKCKEFKTANLVNINNINNQIGRIRSQIDKINELSNIQKIEGDQAAIKNEINNLNAQLAALGEQFTQESNKIHKELMKRNQDLAEVKTLGTNKAKEIAFIEKGVCPTCGAPIDQSQLEIKKKERTVLLEQYKTIASDIKAIQESLTPISAKYKEDRTELQESLDDNKKLLTRLQEQAKRMSINFGEIENLESNISELNASLADLQTEDQQWELLYNILSNDVKSSIINSFIPLLNKNILKYTQRLQQPYIISFDPSFNCTIEKCGFNQKISLNDLSTGQLKIVNTCIIFGMLGTIIGSNKLNIQVLDELMANMHPALCNEMCEVLKSSMKPGDTMFIISHTETDNKYFDGIINISMDNQNQFEGHSVFDIKKFGPSIWMPKQNMESV